MCNVTIGQCEFCLEDNKVITPVGCFLGWYCEECISLVEAEAQSAIHEIEKWEKENE